MKVVTGQQFNTSIGKMVIPDDQEMFMKQGEIIFFEGKRYSIARLVMGCGPGAKHSIEIEEFNDSDIR